MSNASTILLSGGIDSMVCLALAMDTGRNIDVLHIDYGQVARTHELSSAKEIAGHFGVKLRVISIDFGKQFGVGEIPNRNAGLIFSAAMAISNSSDEMILGVHAGTEYEDCSPEFLLACQNVLQFTNNSHLSLIAPLKTWSKAEILAYSMDKGLPLSKTYSCESGTFPPCGICASCMDRIELTC